METNKLVDELIALLAPLGKPKVLKDCDESSAYNQARLVFNRKFEFRPTVIIFVTNTQQVQAILEFANTNNVKISVRSGGHDHEGECSATDSWQIDFSEMHAIEASIDGRQLKPNEKINDQDNTESLRVKIQPGARFERVKPKLDEHNLGIPHGTCRTVAIAGYTLGGGWGPWTRLYGMGCEYLVGATVVLGSGKVVEVSDNDPVDSANAKLLWALRGGGGLSYGIVTELIFKPFVLPPITFNFSISSKRFFPNAKAVDILELWENAIKPGNNSSLIGTNLKIVAQHIDSDKDRDPNAALECVMNGYFGGPLSKLIEMITGWRQQLVPLAENNEALVQGMIGESNGLNIHAHIVPKNQNAPQATPEIDWPFYTWDRAKYDSNGDLQIHLDPDCPAPHKITSRLGNKNWDKKSREALICSLQSPLLPTFEEGNNNPGVEYGFDTFITIGAITGEFYANYDQHKMFGSAFPYKDQLFTIQYQAWWNQPIRSEEGLCNEIGGKDQKIKNREFSNRTEDWIETCRDYTIPNTGGAFISFKDSSVTTARYFSQNYNTLMEIKLKFSEDKNFLLRSRKTII